MRKTMSFARPWRAAGIALLATALLTPLGAAASATEQAAPPRPLATGWFGWWATEEQVVDLAERQGGAIDEVNVFWWFFDGPSRPLCTYDNQSMSGACVTGTPTPWTTEKFGRMRTTLQGAGVRVLASITDLDSARAGQLATYISDPANRASYARQIRTWATRAGVDGVDLDWENFAFNDGRSTWSQTKPAFIAMVRRLSRELHAAGLTLSVTVPAGWQPFLADGSPNPGTGYWVYAWKEIIPYVDRLRIMAYDYSWDQPGPIGPNDWAARVVDSALAQVGRTHADKIWIGVPQYGRNWPLRRGSGWDTRAGCPADWTPDATPVRTNPTIEQARAIAVRESVTPTWVTGAGEWTFRYYLDYAGTSQGRPVTCAIQREVWFSDTRSARARVSLAMNRQIAGVAAWQFGQVTSDFYPTMARLAQRWAKEATQARVSAPAEAEFDSAIPLRAVVTAGGARVAGATVVLRFLPASGSEVVAVDEVRTASDGVARFAPTATQSGAWSVHVKGDWARLPADSASSPTTVLPLVDARVATSVPRAGRTLRVDARVRPALGGLDLALQRRTPDGWRTEARARTQYDGSATLAYVPAVAEEVRLRVVARPSQSYGRGASRTLAVIIAR